MDKQKHYETIIGGVAQVIKNSSSPETILLETCKLLAENVDHYNWVGFYLVEPGKKSLFLGPYVGAPTDHVSIPFGQGICGQVAESKKSMVVQDVNAVDNYLACSLHVKSEIVVPVFYKGDFIGELDIDSHTMAPFTEWDEILLKDVAAKVSDVIPEFLNHRADS
jgi:L-methionine (R)-S-oxide reductase